MYVKLAVGVDIGVTFVSVSLLFGFHTLIMFVRTSWPFVDHTAVRLAFGNHTAVRLLSLIHI